MWVSQHKEDNGCSLGPELGVPAVGWAGLLCPDCQLENMGMCFKACPEVFWSLCGYTRRAWAYSWLRPVHSQIDRDFLGTAGI